MQACSYSFGIGVNFKGMEVAIQNDEINLNDCQYFNSNGCIFDKNTSQPMSCVAMNYLSSLNYSLVSIQKGFREVNIFCNF